MSSALIRIDPSAGCFVIIGNEMANDSRLSLEARGLALFLLSKPPTFSIRVTSLPGLLQEQSSVRGHVGRERVRKMLRQLQDAGYLSRDCKRDARGHWVWDFVLRGFAMPVAQQPVDGLPSYEVSGDGNLVDKEQNNLSKDKHKKNKQTTTVCDDIPDLQANVITFDAPFVGDVKQQASELLKKCPLQQRQLVVNEVVWVFQRGKLRGNPCGLLRRLIESAKAGVFAPNATHSKRTTHGVPETKERPSSESCNPLHSPRSASDATSRILDEIRQSLRTVPTGK